MPTTSVIPLKGMAANNIDSDQYVDGSIDAVHLSANSVDSSAYVDGSIDAVHLSANSVDSDSYVDASIDNAHLADDAVGVAELSATGTASSSTFLRGDNAWAAAGGGKLLQVIQTSYSTQLSSIGDTGLTATITPSATSSKVLVFVSQSGCTRAAWSSGGVILKLYRASTLLVTFEAKLSSAGSSTFDTVSSGSTTWLDSPSTTSATTYKTTFGSSSGGMYVQYGGATSTITLVEIGA